MDKQELQEWESKCIQEEPPGCSTGCPIHVDARQFVTQASAGKWEDALKSLAKTMPFPRILGRICDHPCEASCRRGHIETPIAIGHLERVCVETAVEPVRTVILQRKQTTVAVMGSSLAALSVCWDLVRKGYQITIFEPSDRLGGSLWNLPAERLPADIITAELMALEKLGVSIELCSDLSGSGRIADIRTRFDALFIDLETPDLDSSDLERDERGRIACHPLTRATSLDGVFGGGGNGSPIYNVLEGRKAATSIDRYTMNINLENGRELEGPYPTKLYCNIEGKPSLSRITPADTVSGYNAEEAIREAGRCLQCECMECVKVCLYLDRNNGYPKKYTRQVFNNEYVMHGRARTKNQFVNSCSNCCLCESVCPNNFHVGTMMLQARKTMLRTGVMPLSFHEFALLDMEQSNSPRCALRRHEPGRESSSWLYFPSCQLCASSPAEVTASYAYLRQNLEGGVGIMLGCCGAPAFWAGREDLFHQAQDSIREAWEQLGKPKVITACSTCRSLFQKQQPGMELHTLWEIVGQHGLPEQSLKGDSALSVTDPCMARHDRATHQQVRQLISALGHTIEELPLSGEKAECCGFGGLMFNADPALARDVITHRVTRIEPPDTALYRQSISDNDYLAYCAMCRDNLAAGGKRVSHLIERLFPTSAESDPAGRGWISWTERRHNRAALRETILGLHDERGETVREEFGMITLFMSEAMRKTVDERRILESDLKRVIQHAETTGQKLYHAKSGHYRGYLKLGNVTFWTEYTPRDSGFTIHNAYSHRMNIVGAKP